MHLQTTQDVAAQQSIAQINSMLPLTPIYLIAAIGVLFAIRWVENCFLYHPEPWWKLW